MFSFAVGCISFSEYATRDDSAEVERLSERIAELQKAHDDLLLERNMLQNTVETLSRSNNTLRKQTEYIPVTDKYVKSSIDLGENNPSSAVVSNALLIHQQYIRHITSAEPPKEKLWSREKMYNDGLLQPSQWNEAMKALREAGAVVRQGEGNNTQSHWISNDSKTIQGLLHVWAGKNK